MRLAATVWICLFTHLGFPQTQRDIEIFETVANNCTRDSLRGVLLRSNCNSGQTNLNSFRNNKSEISAGD